MAKVYKTFDQARIKFERADLLLARPTSLPGRLISKGSIGEHSHAAMLAARNGEWVVLDVLQWRGGSSHPLRKSINDYPGAWEHFKVNTARFPEFDREGAERRMWEFDDCRYGWRELFLASLIYVPGIRLFQQVESLCIDNGATVDTVDKHGNPVKPMPPFCSMAYCIAAEFGGGVDPVKHLRHSMTTPSHLAQSHLFTYECTLVPEGDERCVIIPAQ